MTNQEQRFEIARFCGWTDLLAADDHILWGKCPVTKYEHFIPSYTVDLNAMHKAEKVLTPTQYEIFALHLGPLTKIRQREYISSTAQQRAEAFLKTIGKWKE